jgi:predicted dehydrogenase
MEPKRSFHALMATQDVRWGILGAAVIARKNWLAIKNSGNGIVKAVASRDVERARALIDECQADAAFDPAPDAVASYEELIARDDIDAVYVPLPTGLRKEWVIRAANAGKHVLCEKPCATSAKDLEEMIVACRANDVQFMDGLMFMHTERMQRVRQAIDDGTSVGKVKRITAQFSFCGPEDFYRNDIRLNSDLEPYGCFGDLGWYCIRFILWTMNWQVPSQVSAQILTSHQRENSPKPVPTEFSAELRFADGASASFYTSYLTENQQWVNVSGDKGYLRIDDFVLPFEGDTLRFEVENSTFEVTGCDFAMKSYRRVVTTEESSRSHGTAQESNLFREFARLVLSGKTDARWPDISLATQRVLDACYESAVYGRRSDGVLV